MTTLFRLTVRNLSPKVSDSKFIEYLSKFGDVQDVKFRKDKVYAFFRTKRAAEKAANEIDGKKFEGSPVSASFAIHPVEPKKDPRARSRSHSLDREPRRPAKRRPSPRRSFSRSTSRG